jgi:CDP-glucose 4,6-dehydratase
MGFWNSKKVLITGINGFVGGNIAKKLVTLGAKVYGLVRTRSSDSFLFYEKIDKKVSLITGELCDLSLLCRIISEQEINVVFHLAAQVEVGIGLRNPYITFETNIKGTYSLLEAVRLFPDSVQAVVVASSDKAYGEYEKEKMPYKEDYPLIPKYPYDTSKACADMIAQTYTSEVHNLPVVITRFSNIYGPGQLNFSALIPDGIRSALGYSKFVPRGDGTMMRDFLYISDVVDLYLNIAENLAKNKNNISGQIFNAGSNKPKTVKQILENIFTNLGANNEYIRIIKEMKNTKTVGEIDCQFMDHVKVKKYFGWTPKHSFNDGISETIDWYKKYLKYVQFASNQVR